MGVMNYKAVHRIIDGLGKLLDTTPGSPDVGSYVTEAELAEYVKGKILYNGYLYNGDFYKEAAHTNVLPKTNGALYVDETDPTNLALYVCLSNTYTALTEEALRTELANGTFIPARATGDKDGNQIDLTYETKADASDLKSAIQSNTARIENLEQEHGGLVITQYRGSNSVPSGKATNAKVTTIVGKSRPWNNLVGSSTTSVSTTSGKKYLTVISGTASIIDGGSSVSVTGGVDIVRDLNLIFPEYTNAQIATLGVSGLVAICPDLLTYDSYGYSLVDTEVEGVESVGFNRLDLASYMQTLGISKSGDYYTDLVVNYDNYSNPNPFPINWLPSTQYSFRITGHVSATASPYVRVEYTDGTADGTSAVNKTSDVTRTYTSALGKTIAKAYISYGGGGADTFYLKSITVSIGTDATKDAEYMTSTLSLPTSVILRSAVIGALV